MSAQLQSQSVEAAQQELRRSAAVLSGPGGRQQAAAELRDRLCLLDTGELLVADNACLDHGVLAYQDMLKRNQFDFRVVRCTMDEVRAHYAANGDHDGGTPDKPNSVRQEQVLRYIRAAVAAGASDLHFVISPEMWRLRQRVHGVLETLVERPAADGQALVATIYQSMCDVAETTYKPNQPQDGRLKESFLASAGLFGARIATRPTDRGTLMVLRLLHNQGTRHRSLSELGYSETHAKMIRTMTRRKTGINIFSGETGSGKSTSLEVLLGMLLRNFDNKLHVLTLEDPPEYRIPGANQTPVIDGDWPAGIRNMMRLDPNVIMIGEMRDYESAQAAFRAAMTGHGVWTTLHANDAIAILQRLTDIGVDPGLMTDPSIVTGLINQNLARTLCPHCKQPWTFARPKRDPELVERVEQRCDITGIHVRGPGCDRCRNTGVSGRTVIAEVAVPTRGLMDAYRTGGKVEAKDYWVKRMGGITKAMHLVDRINHGSVDPELGEEDAGPIDADDFVLEGA